MSQHPILYGKWRDDSRKLLKTCCGSPQGDPRSWIASPSLKWSSRNLTTGGRPVLSLFHGASQTFFSLFPSLLGCPRIPVWDFPQIINSDILLTWCKRWAQECKISHQHARFNVHVLTRVQLPCRYSAKRCHIFISQYFRNVKNEIWNKAPHSTFYKEFRNHLFPVQLVRVTPFLTSPTESTSQMEVDRHFSIEIDRLSGYDIWVNRQAGGEADNQTNSRRQETDSSALNKIQTEMLHQR